MLATLGRLIFGRFYVLTIKEGVLCLESPTAACSLAEHRINGARAKQPAAPHARVSSPCRRHASTSPGTTATTSVPTDTRGAQEPKQDALRPARGMASSANWTACILQPRSPTSTAAGAYHIGGSGSRSRGGLSQPGRGPACRLHRTSDGIARRPASLPFKTPMARRNQRGGLREERLHGQTSGAGSRATCPSHQVSRPARSRCLVETADHSDNAGRSWRNPIQSTTFA